MVRYIDGKLFAKMIEQGAQNLSNNVNLIDSLNVYPVPDGDTGTNMNLTMTSGNEAVSNQASSHIGQVGQVFAKGLLMGARGNSGVILSQIFRGFCQRIEQDAEIDVPLLAKALQASVETAYQAIVKPVEGTILTVAKDTAEKAMAVADSHEEMETFFQTIIEAANQSLENTPNLLPVLKEVGVVDSGGKGLVTVLEGFLAGLKGETIEAQDSSVAENVADVDLEAEAHDFHGVMNTEDIQYGYCTEVMARFDDAGKTFDEQQFREDMSTFGDSLLVINDDEIVKVHVHSEKPGDVFNYVQQYGELIKLKVENMREQHREVEKKEQSQQGKQEDIAQVETAIIAISMGEGISELFKSMGATHIISGGQTMNPSTEDIVKVIEQSGCQRAMILPNNKNIILASEQAADMVQAETVVIPTRSVPQGITALFNLDHDAELSENKEVMTEALEAVVSGAVTTAVRDTQVDGVTINENDYIGLMNDKIVTSDAQLTETLHGLMEQMVTDDSEIITLISGQDANAEETEALIEWIEAQYPEVEIDEHDGQQPVYPYLFAVE